MKKLLTAALLLLGAYTAVMTGSGPYMPPRVEPRQSEDLVYRVGQALYSGEMKIGAGQACSSCHKGGLSFKKSKLKEISQDNSLEPKIYKCVTQTDRVNGTIEKSQMIGLVRFLRKRYKL